MTHLLAVDSVSDMLALLLVFLMRISMWWL
jgi:hypothetical protein